MGVMIQENEVVRMPTTGWDTDPPLGTATIFGFHTPPIIPALWHSLTSRQPGCCLMRSIRRAKAVFDNFRDLWNDFCLWSSQRQFHELDPEPSTFSEQDHNAWRGPKAAQYQIGYEDPSADPKWRMKQIVEVKDYHDINRVFHVASSNLTWYVGGYYSTRNSWADHFEGHGEIDTSGQAIGSFTYHVRQTVVPGGGKLRSLRGNSN